MLPFVDIELNLKWAPRCGVESEVELLLRSGTCSSHSLACLPQVLNYLQFTEMFTNVHEGLDTRIRLPAVTDACVRT